MQIEKENKQLPTYKLNDHTLLIVGYKNACIFDNTSRKLFHINESAKELILNLIKNSKIPETDEENKFILNLINQDIISPELNFKRVKNEKPINKISFAWIEITKLCNLKCIHCYNNTLRNMTMSIEDIDIVIDELKKNNINRVQIIGGEPLLVKNQLKYLVEKLSEFQSIEIFTNGTLLTQEWCDFFKSESVSIAVSLYSNSKFEHEKVTRVKNSYQKTINGINLLRANKITYRVACVEMNGVDVKWNNNNFIINSDVVRLSGNANIRLLNKELIKKKLITKNSFKKDINIDFSHNMVYHNCFGNNIYIDALLNVYPCVMERKFKHGSLKKGELKDVLNRNIIALTKDYIEECRYCEYRYNCFDCRPDRISSDRISKPWYCTYDPKTGKWEDEDTFIKNILNNNNNEV